MKFFYNQEDMKFICQVLQSNPEVVSSHYKTQAHGDSDYYHKKFLEKLLQRVTTLANSDIVFHDPSLYIFHTTYEGQKAIHWDAERGEGPMMSQSPQCPKCGQSYFSGYIFTQGKVVIVEPQDSICPVPEHQTHIQSEILIDSGFVFSNFFEDGLKLNEGPNAFHDINYFQGKISFSEYHQRNNQVYVQTANTTVKICVNKEKDEILIVDNYLSKADRLEIPKGFRSHGTISCSVWSVIGANIQDPRAKIPDRTDHVLLPKMKKGLYTVESQLVHRSPIHAHIKLKK